MSENSSTGTSPTLPTDGAWDATLSLLREGYHFIPNRCRRLDSDIFRTRLTLTDVICMQGPRAAELFYGDAPLTRRQAMPQTVLRLLQDKGSVQQLDGAAHRHRKALFVSILTAPHQVERLSRIFQEEWIARLSFWQKQKQVVLFDEVNLILTRAACRWAGVPTDDDHAMTGELSGMIEHAGHFRPSTLAALWRRRHTERHVRKLVEQIRSGRLASENDLPIHRIATFRDMDGEALSAQTAAVEMINMLRPIVAVGRFVTFAAMELHKKPEWKALLNEAPDEALERFAEEIRRVSPFFPFVGARTREEVRWRGHVFPKGQWLLLDLYGTTHDPQLFPKPEEIELQRCLSWRDQGYDFIPQGAGKVATSHRCPGEMVTVELLKQSVRHLIGDMDYRVPRQNFSVKMNRVPTLPESGFVMEEVRARPRN